MSPYRPDLPLPYDVDRFGDFHEDRAAYRDSQPRGGQDERLMSCPCCGAGWCGRAGVCGVCGKELVAQETCHACGDELEDAA